MLFKKEYILLDKKFLNNEDLFQYIDKILFSQNISSKSGIVFKGFSDREKQGTTGFEDGFAIPHARIDGISDPSIFVIRNKSKFSNWESLDGGGVQYAIALIIPENSRDFHIDVLSTLASKLIDADFRNIIKNGDVETINTNFLELLKEINAKHIDSKLLKEKKQVLNNDASDKKEFLIGVSACPAGIAHTFMVKTKMENLAKEKNINIKWETQGAKGQKNTLNDKDINNASTIIIASDIDLDLSRFKGKNIYMTTTNEVIKNTNIIYEQSKINSKVFSGNVESIENSKNYFSRFINLFIKSFKSNFGVPWTYLSITATVLAFISLIGFSIYGQIWATNAYDKNINLFKIQAIASFALSLSMPFMAMFIVKKMTKRSDAQYLAFLASLMLNIPFSTAAFNSINMDEVKNQFATTLFYDWSGYFKIGTLGHGSNIIGSLIVTLLIVFIYKTISKFEKYILESENKFSKILAPAMSPWVSTFIPAVFFLIVVVFMFGAPLSFASSKISYALIVYPSNHWWLRFIIGFVFGVLIAWDLGNTINKFSLIVLIGLAQYDLRFASLIAVGIPLASIGLGTTHFFNKKSFKKEDKKDVSLSFRKGLNGMTEGPLNLKIKYKWKVNVPNIIATGIATGVTLILGIYILNAGYIRIFYLGAQAHLAQINDLNFLNSLLPRGEGIVTAICSILYGIMGYFFVMGIGCISYLGISNITFRIGKNKIFIRKKRK